MADELDKNGLPGLGLKLKPLEGGAVLRERGRKDGEEGGRDGEEGGRDGKE